MVWWCGGVVMWWCGGVVVWWCGGAVVWWCGGCGGVNVGVSVWAEWGPECDIRSVVECNLLPRQRVYCAR